MKKQLTSALKKSISAEQQAVTGKKSPTTAAKAPAKPTAPKKVAVAKLATPVAQKTTKEVLSNIKQTAAKPNTAKAPEPKVEVKPETSAKSAASAQPFNSAMDALNTLASKNQKLIETSLEALATVNSEIGNYLNSLTQAKQLTDLTSIHMDFINKINHNRKTLLETTVAILTQAKK